MAADRLAVLAGPQASLTPTEVAAAADGLVELVFLVDRAGGAAAEQVRAVAGALAPTLAVDLADADAGYAALRDARVRAVTTFTDALAGPAARLAERLGGPPAPAWGRKDEQRRALRAAGVSRVRSAVVSDRASLRAFVDAVGLPVVVKPTGGAASRDVWLLHSARDVAAYDEVGPMLAEQFIVGEPRPQRPLADYVSVEVFRPGGAFVTDRLAPAWPCREAGLVLPSVLPAAEQAPLVAAAEAALDCLGATAGVAHVELKPGRPAPDVVEANGRLGGFLGRLVRYGTGADLGREALRCALGEPAQLDLDWRRSALVLLFQAPAAAARVVRAPTRREVARRPGVVAVDEVAPAGTALDWRDGTNAAVAWVWLAADDPAGLRARLADLAGWLGDAYGFVDRRGRPVRDQDWLDRITERS